MEPILDSSFPENCKFDAVMGARKGGVPLFALIPSALLVCQHVEHHAVSPSATSAATLLIQAMGVFY
jgi:hypothetical protein